MNFLPLSDDARPVVVALTVGLIGGWTALKLGVPLGALIGALLAVAALRPLGVRAAAPESVRKTGQLVIGTAIGLHFTPEVATRVVADLPLLTGAAAFLILAGGAFGLALARFSGVDARTGWFSSLPGGAAEMTALAIRHGGRPATVALTQSTRVIVVVVVVPAVVTLAYGAGGDGADHGATGVFRPLGLAAMLGASFICGFILDRLRFPNGYLFGGMGVGMALAVAQLDVSAMPAALTDGAQWLLGTVLGCRFHRGDAWPGRRFLIGTLLTTAALIAVGWGVALLLGPRLGMDAATGILAAAPGGMAEMSITAQVLGLSIPTVTAWHLLRIVLVTSLGAQLFPLLEKIFHFKPPPQD
jgi:uncharacterized protein